MLPRSSRISRTAFPEAAKRGRRYTAPHISLTFSPAPLEPGVSFVTSKAVAKKATERNILKRRGYASIEGLGFRKAPFPGKAIFYFKKGAPSLSFKLLSLEIEGLLREAGVFTGVR